MSLLWKIILGHVSERVSPGMDYEHLFGDFLSTLIASKMYQKAYFCVCLSQRCRYPQPF